MEQLLQKLKEQLIEHENFLQECDYDPDTKVGKLAIKRIMGQFETKLTQENLIRIALEFTTDIFGVDDDAADWIQGIAHDLKEED